MSTNVEEFRLFHQLLTNGRPDYQPFYFALRPGGKEPLGERGPWKDASVSFDEACDWMKAGYNIAIAGTDKDGLVIVDVDKEGAIDDVKATLCVRTRKRTGRHYFYFTNDLRCKVNVPSAEHVGELRSLWQYVVAAGSYVRTDPKKLEVLPPEDMILSLGSYTVENDLPVASITFEELPLVFRKTLAEQGAQQQAKREPRKWRREGQQSKLWSLSLQDVIGEYPGTNFPSPFHGSETGNNTTVSNGLLHCWRHNVSMTPLQALTVKSGILDCMAAGDGHAGSAVGPSVIDFKDKEFVLRLWDYAKKNKIVPEDDPHPFEDTIAARVPGYRPPEAYFEIVEHPRSNRPPSYVFLPGELAQDIKKIEHILTDGEDEQVYFYKDGWYQRHGDVEIKKTIERVLGKLAKTITKNQVSEIIDQLKRKTYIYRSELKDDPNLLPLKNGVLNWRTKEFVPYDPDKHLFFTQLPIKYDPNAKCPEIEKWLATLVEQSDTTVLKEIPALCLHRENAKIATMLVGETDAGKTEYEEWLRAFLGKRNTTTKSLHAVTSDKFQTAGLRDKYANIYDDLTNKALKETGPFKVLTGGGQAPLEQKYHEPGDFEPYCKHIYGCNKIPRSENDDSMAFFGRWRLVMFPYLFVDREPHAGTNERRAIDRSELRAIIRSDKEMSGFLNMAVNLMPDVVRHGLTSSLTAEENMTLYIKLSDSLRAFVQECSDFSDPEAVIAVAELYSHYVAYCEENGLEAASTKSVSQRLPQLDSRIKPFREQYDEKEPKKERPRSWKGINVKPWGPGEEVRTPSKTATSGSRPNLDTDKSLPTGEGMSSGSLEHEGERTRDEHGETQDNPRFSSLLPPYNENDEKDSPLYNANEGSASYSANNEGQSRVLAGLGGTNAGYVAPPLTRPEKCSAPPTPPNFVNCKTDSLPILPLSYIGTKTEGHCKQCGAAITWTRHPKTDEWRPMVGSFQHNCPKRRRKKRALSEHSLPPTPTNGKLDALNEETKQYARKRLEDMQRRACPNGVEHEVNGLHAAINRVIEIKTEGRRPGVHELYTDIPRQFPGFEVEVKKMLETFGAEIVVMGVDLYRLRGRSA